MARHPNRREFLQTTAAVAGVGFFSSVAAAQQSKSPNEKIRFACVGVAGKGSSDSANAGAHGDIVAICDIEDKRLDGASKRFTTARKYNDYRKMFDEMGKDIDAVTVSTPDHMHAVIAAMAMKMGKHCYCQKPLTHDIYEARKLGEIAREMKVATQMGNQGTAEPGLRKAAAMLRNGLLGTVQHVHVWTNRPIWEGQGEARPKERPVPTGVHWDLWIGTAPYRPYANGYHDFAWRGWWDFGTGALGDMACHTVNMPYMGLELRDPTSVQAVTSGHNGDSYPKSSKIDFEFPANDWRPALKFTWYDGGNMPSRDMMSEKFLKRNRDTGAREMYIAGCLIVGEKGKLFSPDDYARQYVVEGVDEPETVEFERSPGGSEEGHVKEWIMAIQGGKPARSNFPDYAGPLTETILLGNLAVYAAPKAGEPGKKVEWNAKEMKATNAPELAQIVKREYRSGYSL